MYANNYLQYTWELLKQRPPWGNKHLP
uniref:Uncharacterized protein n=1 Tax=Anguilla anguilla TaxID=7936 RepID=A0A0E9SR07_ANGAN